MAAKPTPKPRPQRAASARDVAQAKNRLKPDLKNLVRYGLSRSEILAFVREVMDAAN